MPFSAAIGKATSTKSYQAELGQFDASWTWASGSLIGSAGRGSYDDDDSTADNRRSFKFLSDSACTGNMEQAVFRVSV
jgi:hypothetical protein